MDVPEHHFVLDWIIDFHAYQSVTDEDCKAVMVKAQEVLKMGSSLLFGKNYVVQPQAYDYFLNWPCGDCARGCVVCYP